MAGPPARPGQRPAGRSPPRPMPGQPLAQSLALRSWRACRNGRTPTKPRLLRLPCAEHRPGRGLAAHTSASPAAATSRWPGPGRPAVAAPARAPFAAAWSNPKAGHPALRTSTRDRRCTALSVRLLRADAVATTRSWPRARRPTGRP
ncbi:hypothetical protein SDC9_110730 [bioreactor metagenome]|uniref:Uncharacterized protein n=1 Tax=bioreactor metagenome TaxID=1076179 RepID=A0A645BFF1_9ZZZZ